MSYKDPTDPVKFDDSPHLHTGDNNDNDAADLEWPTDLANEPPKPVEEPIDLTPNTPLVRCQRLMTGSMQIDPSWDKPTLILPEDALRSSVVMGVIAENTTDYINLADETDKLEYTTSSGRIYPTSPIPLFDNYTGPVWVTAKNSSAAVTVSWWAVTK